MTKLLMWLLLAFVVMYVLRNKKNAARKTSRPENRPFRHNPPAGDGQVETMLRCAFCGVHLPESEALRNPAGAVFCSEEHRLQYGAR